MAEIHLNVTGKITRSSVVKCHRTTPSGVKDLHQIISYTYSSCISVQTAFIKYRTDHMPKDTMLLVR